MKKNYIFYLFLSITLFTSQYIGAQNKGTTNFMEEKIENLTIYPNPVSSQNTFVNIISKENATKTIEFYNVLGKRLFSTKITGKQLNISQLSKGVYLLRITENKSSETRKLVVK
ncbi:T9SS type A sorting domain-containing protein [Tamlana sp. I1]|uniref:T9SS type A sorting domain-containing protein n=1 Tax=Tamlana sp. I1 TaxID=2762061 RepID=UPI00188F8AE3|nr:T9SS type A sorting domain-containing protein [Tamlana sp. I1]